MARPTQTRLGSGGGYGPTQQGATQRLGVYAPLNVQTGASGAEHLARALGMGVDAALPFMKQKIAKEGADAATRGLGAAADGVSPEEQKLAAADAAFGRGLKRGMAAKAAADYRTAAQELYDTIDPATSTEEVGKKLDALARSKLGMFLDDPDAAKWVVGDVMSTYGTVTGQHQHRLSVEAKTDAVEGILARVKNSAVDVGEVQYQENFDALAVIVGRTEAHKMMVAAVTSVAEEHGAPALLEQIPGSTTLDDGRVIAGPRETYSEAIGISREKADNVAAERKARQHAEWRSDFFLAAEDRFAAGGAFSKRELQEVRREGKITQQEEESLYRRGFAAREAAKQKVELDLAATRGVPLYMLDISEGDKDNITKEWVDIDASAHPDENGNPDTFGAAMRAFAKHGHVDPRIKGFLAKAPLTEEASTQKTLDYYQRLPLHMRSAFVPDSDRRIQIETMLAQVEAGSPVPAVIEAAKDFNPQVAKANLARAERDMNKAIRSDFVVGSVPGKLWGTNEVKISEVVNPEGAYGYIDRQVKARVARGVAPDVALKAAQEDFAASYTLTKGTDDLYYVIPRLNGAPEDMGQAMQWAEGHLKQFVPDAPAGSHFATDPQGRLVVVGPDGLPVSPARIKPDALYSKWMEATDAARFKAMQDANASFVARRKRMETDAPTFFIAP